MELVFIKYNLKLHGFPLSWESEISNFQNETTFTDQQLKGPYKKWVHTHDFLSVKNGTLMRDVIVYKVPFGIFGRIFGGAFVRRDVNNIFKYRFEKINEIFS